MVKSDSFTSEKNLRIRLKSVTQHDATWAAQLAREIDIFFNVQDRVTLSLRKAYGTSKEAINQLSGEIETQFANSRRQIEMALVGEAFDRLESDANELAHGLMSVAEQGGTMVGRPAPPWEALDLEGKRHTSKGLKGRVVVLDFWQTSCVPCLKAMPQLMEVAEHFKDSSVAVLSMNTDAREQDARLVKEKLKLTLPVLLAQDVANEYQVRGYPMLAIVDQAGTIRHYHMGFSPALRDHLTDIIEDLLKFQ